MDDRNGGDVFSRMKFGCCLVPVGRALFFFWNKLVVSSGRVSLMNSCHPYYHWGCATFEVVLMPQITMSNVVSSGLVFHRNKLFQDFMFLPPNIPITWSPGQILATKPLVGHPKWWFSKGSVPPKFPEFRFRNYCNLRSFCNIHTKLGGGFKYLFYFHPDSWGNDPIWRSYFSNGVAQPPTKKNPSPRRWMMAEATLLNATVSTRASRVPFGFPSEMAQRKFEFFMVSWRFSTYHPRSRTINKGVIRPYQGKPMVNIPGPFVWPYFKGGLRSGRGVGWPAVILRLCRWFWFAAYPAIVLLFFCFALVDSWFNMENP